MRNSNNNANNTNVIPNSTSRGCKAEPYPFNASAVFRNLKNTKILKRVQDDNAIVVLNNIKDKNANELINLSTYRLIDFKEILPAIVLQDDVKNIKTLVPQCPSALMPLKKKAAFTLAEVLITLGIIGVVAAMTIPGLINNYKAQRLRTQFLKSYSTVQQAFKLMQEDDVSLDPETYSHGSYYKVFLRYLSGAFDCGNTTASSGTPLKNTLPCYNMYGKASNNKPYKTLDKNTNFNQMYLDDGEIALPDGTLLLFENQSKKVFVSIDINGYNNPPNVAGYDLFTFDFLDEEMRPMGGLGTHYTDLDKYCNPNVSNNINGIACAQKAKDNTDYFKDLVKQFK